MMLATIEFIKSIIMSQPSSSSKISHSTSSIPRSRSASQPNISNPCIINNTFEKLHNNPTQTSATTTQSSQTMATPAQHSQKVLQSQSHQAITHGVSIPAPASIELDVVPNTSQTSVSPAKKRYFARFINLLKIFWNFLFGKKADENKNKLPQGEVVLPTSTIQTLATASVTEINYDNAIKQMGTLSLSNPSQRTENLSELLLEAEDFLDYMSAVFPEQVNSDESIT